MTSSYAATTAPVRPPKAALGRLDEVKGLDDQQIQRLRALSVTTVEELLGLVASDPEAAAQFLGVQNLAQLQADVAPKARSELVRAVAAEEEPQFTFGAIAPQGVEVEQRASQATFEAYAATVEEGVPETVAEEEPPVFLGCFGTVRDQHARGTCVAHAVCAVLECLYAQSTGDSIDFSEQFAYWDAKQHDGHPNDEGTFIEVSLPQTQHDGVCEEAVWPYNPNPIPGNEAQGPPPAGAQTAAQAHLSSNVTQLDARNPRDIRNAIDAKHPVAISVPVYQNWFNNPAVNLYGTIPMPLPTSVLKGGHALCVAGYGFSSDFTGGGYFILRNSWGPQWAALSSFQPGYGAIPFDYVANYAWEAFTADGVS